MSSPLKSTFTTHTHALHKFALGLWEAAQDSELPWILKEFLCTKHVHGDTPYPQFLSVPQPYLLPFFPHKDTGAGSQESYV